MGGLGSGNALDERARPTTESQHSIDAAYLNQQGILVPGFAGTLSWSCRGKSTGSIGVRTLTHSLWLHYISRGDSLAYAVQLDRTPCHYGGSRVWLRCPTAGCDRRVRILYGGHLFACRYCHELAFASTRESTIDLLARRGDAIRRRLGWQEGMLNSPEGRPKGMHWRTYNRLLCEYENIYSGFLRAVDNYFT